MENTNNQTPARSSEEQLKAKYGGKLYRVGITVPVDDESEKEFSYYFKRPTVPSYDRYIKTAAQGITKASKAFMLDAVIDEDAERLTKDMEENPGIAISIGNKADGDPRPDGYGKFEEALRERVAEVRESFVERGLLEIYRFVPPPLLETFDPETIDDVDEFLGWVAKARFMQELEEGIVTRAIVRAFPE